MRDRLILGSHWRGRFLPAVELHPPLVMVELLVLQL